MELYSYYSYSWNINIGYVNISFLEGESHISQTSEIFILDENHGKAHRKLKISGRFQENFSAETQYIENTNYRGKL